MSQLEREILEKFQQLQPAAKQRIRALIEQEIALTVEQTDAPIFDYAIWMRDIEILRQQIRANQRNQSPAIDVVGILRGIRDGEDE